MSAPARKFKNGYGNQRTISELAGELAVSKGTLIAAREHLADQIVIVNRAEADFTNALNSLANAAALLEDELAKDPRKAPLPAVSQSEPEPEPS